MGVSKGVALSTIVDPRVTESGTETLARARRPGQERDDWRIRPTAVTGHHKSFDNRIGEPNPRQVGGRTQSVGSETSAITRTDGRISGRTSASVAYSTTTCGPLNTRRPDSGAGVGHYGIFSTALEMSCEDCQSASDRGWEVYAADT